MSIIEKLTEGIINRDLSREANALLDKWARTGLLEGIENDHGRNSMASLLENQAKELLREASTMAGGDVEGFAAVAFPIVRRVFGGLVANELVSVQPMSLPSGLIFFLDFTYGNDRLAYEACRSIYGGNVIGQQITGGVDLTGQFAESSFYALNNGYSSPTGTVAVAALQCIASGTLGDTTTYGGPRATELDRLCRFDPDLSGSFVAVGEIARATLENVGGPFDWNVEDCVAITFTGPAASVGFRPVGLNNATGSARRLTEEDYTVPRNGNLNFVISDPTSANLASGTIAAITGVDFPIKDVLLAGTALGSLIGAPEWGLEGLGVNDLGDACGTSNVSDAIPEIDIRVDSSAITAITKKLRCKWTPELQQDINAYHNLDAEVELTSILSETIALEIDQEILEDLIKEATTTG